MHAHEAGIPTAPVKHALREIEAMSCAWNGPTHGWMDFSVFVLAPPTFQRTPCHAESVVIFFSLTERPKQKMMMLIRLEFESVESCMVHEHHTMHACPTPCRDATLRCMQTCPDVVTPPNNSLPPVACGLWAIGHAATCPDTCHQSLICLP